MRSLSGVGLGLSIVFGCLLLTLIAELYYLLWWKRRFINRDTTKHDCNTTKELLHMFCFKKQTASCPSLRVGDNSQLNLVQESMNASKDLVDDPLEAELMRLSLALPRSLFTIVEETKEDLESDDGRSKSKKLSELFVNNVETPYLTPLESPSFFTPPITPMQIKCRDKGFNVVFESSREAEFNRIRASPPPKFKFMRDAEEKLNRRKLKEDVERSKKRVGVCQDEENHEPFVAISIDGNSE